MIATSGGRCEGLWSVEPPAAGVEVVEAQCPIDSPPKIVVLNGYHFAVAFPLPAVGPPLVEAAVEDAVDVGAGGDKCQARGTWDCFQSANDGQEFEALAGGIGLGIFDSERKRLVVGFQREAPAWLVAVFADAGMEQEVRSRHTHISAISEGRANGAPMAIR